MGKIASHYAEIGANIKPLQSGLKQAKSDMQDYSKASGKALSGVKTETAGLTDKLKGLSTGALAAAGILGGFGMALSEVYDIAKQGAALENTERKFGRLAETVHTTADALKKDLREATKGTLSDAQLMQSATDLMSLGLVKTHKDTVRLGKVIAGLGMDMNQLVLTMANQTTMRFDQLGVSVVGFDEKVAALKKTGMNANDAFNEAFLQQAEEQLIRVGNAADTDVGSFMRLEASAANLGDAIKRKLAPPLADAAEAMYTLITWSEQVNGALDEQKVSLLNTTRTYDDYVEANIDAAIAAGKLGKNFRESLLYQKKNKDSLFDVTKELKLFTRAQYYGAQASTDAGDATREAMRANAEYGREAEVTGGIIRDQAYDWEGLASIGRDVGITFDEVQANIRDAAGAMAELEVAQGELIAAQENWKSGAGGSIAGMLEQQGAKGEDLYTALDLVDQVMGTHEGTVARQKDAMLELVKTYDPKKPEEFKAGLEELKKTFMPLDASILSTTEKMQLLLDKISDFEGVHTAIIRIVTEGIIQDGAGGSGGTTGTSIGAQETNTGYDINGNGVIGAYYGMSNFKVPPGYNERGGRPFIIRASSGETVNIDGNRNGRETTQQSGNTYILQQHVTQSQTSATQAGFRRLEILAGV